MNMIWLCITLALSITCVICEQNVDTNHIRVFPAVNQSIAGVFQVSYLNDLKQPQYAFNASEARELCSSLGVNIASYAQLKEALKRGLETCRFGWIDEHFAVIPRNKPLSNCGQKRRGLVAWRAPVTQKFDVFCFNESDAQLMDARTDGPLNSKDFSGQIQSPSEDVSSTQNLQSTSYPSPLPSSSLTPKTMDSEAEPARFVGSIQGSSGAIAILITSACAILLIAIIILAYIKMRRSCVLSSDTKQQQEYIQAEEWTCVKNIKEAETAAQEDERIEVDDSAS
uniref:lymphatic vessel endothelial hyaluronic acid receptor 1a n=1 Tax=Scatophagus argus TaxID=75038 RepID=UPI001ED853FF|nr:lymphatic vessel endothelial hyaluronic acid receptor 1a [Scatophagus argus]